MRTFSLFWGLFFLFNFVTFSQSLIEHKVKKGETIYAIAKKYQVKQVEILKLNSLTKDETLKVNILLKIPNKNNKSEESKEPVSKTELTKVERHTIKKGESLYKISKKYGIGITELYRLNPSVKIKLPIGYQLILRDESNSVVQNENSFTEISLKDSTLTNRIDTARLIVVEPSRTDSLIAAVSKFLGVRYKSGGSNTNGFDCSGLLFNTFNKFNITVPRSSIQMSKLGTKISRSEAQKGDLIFFATSKRKSVNHVGMITEIQGNEIKFIHATIQLGVIISSTNEPYYSKRFIQINRIY